MSAYKIYERVKEISSTSGTGTFTLADTVQTGFVRFSDIPGVADGDFVPYCAYDDAASPVTWEVGFGTYNLTAKTLARTGIVSNSSGTTSAINFANAPTVILCDNSSVSGPAPTKLVPGRFYAPASALEAGVASASVLLTPFYVPNPIQLQTLSIKFGGTVNSGTLCLGIVSDNNGTPGTTIAQASQSVSSANANSTVTLSVSQFLVPGLYWIARSLTATANSNVYAGAAGSSAYGFASIGDMTGYSSASNALGNFQAYGFSCSNSPGATLPSTYSSLSLNFGGSRVALVALGF